MPISEAEFNETLNLLQRFEGHRGKTAQALGISDRQLRRRLAMISTSAIEPPAPQEKAPPPRIGTSPDAPRWEIVSRKDNTFCFGAFGDLHAASKYCRWDVRADLMKRSEDMGAQAILDTGNWIDGVSRFNIHDIEAVGMHAQLKLLAANYPKCKVPTYAITGADHEGWYIKSSGIDVGYDCQNVMRDAGHAWTNLGYLEADIILKNANSGATCICRVAHPGKGTSYAVSYRPQKIIESYEGGEKPAILFLGHYHKIDFGLIRNVWYGQTGCQQDQTPFMRLIPTEAQVGGLIVSCEQDPRTGAIISFTPTARRYFNVAYYFKEGKANNRWSGTGPITKVPKVVNRLDG